MYSDDNTVIYTIYVWDTGHIGFTHNKEYSILHVGDYNVLKELTEKYV